MTQDYTKLGTSSSPSAPASSPQEPSRNPIEIRIIPMNSVLTILFTAWKIAKANYGLIMGSTAIFGLISIAISRIPYLSLLASIPAVYLGLGFMNIVRKLVEKQSAKIGDLFLPFEEPRWLGPLLPVAISGVMIALMQHGVDSLFQGAGTFMAMIGGLVNIFLMLLWFALTAFSGPLVAFRGRRFSESIELNLRATHLNWQPLLLGAMAMAGLVIISLIALFVPFFLVAMPILMSSGYLTYAIIFEGLDIESLHRSLEAESRQPSEPVA